jgi:hypothetical protein
VAEPAGDALSELSRQLLDRAFVAVEVWRERIHQDAPQPAAGSRLRADDALTDPYRLSHQVVLALISAVDHFEALLLLVQDAGVMPARAPFTLLRAALENASIAVWLLAPDDRKLRVLRLLRLMWTDGEDNVQAWESVAVQPPLSREERKNNLQEMARAAELSTQQVSQVATLLRWTTIVKGAGDGAQELTGERALLAWRVSSGVAHARPWAALSILDRVEAPVPDGDIVRLKLKASERRVTVVTSIALQMLAEGWRLFDESRRPH